MQTAPTPRAMAPKPGRYACPNCQGMVMRTPRTMLDRIIAMIVGMPMRRYQCRLATCDWSGNLLQAPAGRGQRIDGPAAAKKPAWRTSPSVRHRTDRRDRAA